MIPCLDDLTSVHAGDRPLETQLSCHLPGTRIHAPGTQGHHYPSVEQFSNRVGIAAMNATRRVEERAVEVSDQEGSGQLACSVGAMTETFFLDRLAWP